MYKVMETEKEKNPARADNWNERLPFKINDVIIPQL